MNAVEERPAATQSLTEKRHSDTKLPKLVLVELDPIAIVDGVRVDDCYVTEDISSYGEMRESCPVCEGIHLQLVLRQKNVKAAHLFCARCTRCFDACLPDGTSALTIA